MSVGWYEDVGYVVLDRVAPERLTTVNKRWCVRFCGSGMWEVEALMLE